MLYSTELSPAANIRQRSLSPLLEPLPVIKIHMRNLKHLVHSASSEERSRGRQARAARAAPAASLSPDSQKVKRNLNESFGSPQEADRVAVVKLIKLDQGQVDQLHSLPISSPGGGYSPAKRRSDRVGRTFYTGYFQASPKKVYDLYDASFQPGHGESSRPRRKLGPDCSGGKTSPEKTVSLKKEPVSPKKEPVSPKKEPVSPAKTPFSPAKAPFSPAKPPVSPKKEPVSPIKATTSPKKLRADQENTPEKRASSSLGEEVVVKREKRTPLKQLEAEPGNSRAVKPKHAPEELEEFDLSPLKLLPVEEEEPEPPQTRPGPDKRKSVSEESLPERPAKRQRVDQEEVVEEEPSTPGRAQKRTAPLKRTREKTTPSCRRSLSQLPRPENEEISTPKRVTRSSSRLQTTPATPRPLADLKGTRTPRKTTKTPKTPKNSKTLKTPKTPKTPKTSKSTTARDTPSTRAKRARLGLIKPGVEERTKGLTPSKGLLDTARERLHVSAVPQSLPCRENEFENVHDFLEGKLQDNCGGCMYISGVPGTGKTATATEVVRTLQRRAQQGLLPDFDFYEVNGMRISEPRQAYVEIVKQIQGRSMAWEQAQSFLEMEFTKNKSKKRKPAILLVDELDILCTKRQDVVYNLLDWPSKAKTALIVVAIANTMDLPERLLMGRVTSRLGLTRLTFQPYTHKQLQQIVVSRLVGTEAFNSDAIQLVARKVAAVSGDARRALDICRRATEIAEKEGRNEIVSMDHVMKALQEMISSFKIQAMRSCTALEQLFLQAVVAEVERTGVEETIFAKVFKQLESLAAFERFGKVTVAVALGACSRLGSYRLLITEHGRNDIFQRILLNVSSDDVFYALQTPKDN